MNNIFPKIDWVIFLPITLLTLFGIFMIYSSSIDLSEKTSFVDRQIIYFIFGLVIYFIISLINYRVLLSISPWIYSVTLLLLVVTFILGLETRGSTRWIDLGLINLQASEIAKPVLVLFLSQYFVKNPPNSIKNICISFLIIIIPTFLIFKQPDLGNSIVIFLIWGGLIYIIGIRFLYIVIMTFIGLIAFPIGFSLLKNYQKERLITFFNPNSDPLGSGYNVVQSIIAVGSGQFFGRGFGRGTQSHLNFLPEQKTDFIFATTAEELGFFGIFLILILFSVLLYRIVHIASKADNREGSLICYGAAIIIAVQLFINAGMNMGLLPITGITLPLVSFGGSSLISTMILLGLVSSVYLGRKKRLN